MAGRSRRFASVLRVRLALVLPTLVALLSVVTGVLNISTTRFQGPLAAVVPPVVQQTAGFTGTLTGFLILVSVYGLRRRLRVAWYSTVVLLPVTALQGLAQASPVSYPLVVLSVVSLPTVLANRRVFDRDLSLSQAQLVALGAIVGAQVYGTVGAYALRDHFTGIATPTDAFYYTLVTASTVGYGDVVPTPETQVGKLYAMSVVVIGTASFAVALGSLVAPAIEKRLQKALGTMSDTQLELLEDHVIVVGYGDLTEPVLEELADEVAFVVLARDPDSAQRLREHGYEVLTGDPSEEEPLRRVGVERARALVAATDDDADDAMTVLTARELNPELHVVAAATDRENVKKLRRAGADTVIAPSTIGGHLLVESALGGTDVEATANRILGEDGGT